MKKNICLLVFLIVLSLCIFSACDMFYSGDEDTSEATYTVEFIIDSDNIITKKVESGKKVELPEEPTKTGYTFNCWCSDSELTQTFSSSSIIKKNTKVYAKFDAIWYDASFYDGDTLVGIRSFTIEDVTISDEPSLSSANGYTAKWEDYTLSAQNIDIHAVYTKIEYTISYVLNGGVNNSSNPTKYDILSSITLKDATKTGYYFAGWYKESSFVNKVTTISNQTGNLTLYAKFTITDSENLIPYGSLENQISSGTSLELNDTIKNNICGWGPSGEYVKEYDNTYLKLGMGKKGTVTNEFGNNIAVEFLGLDFSTLGTGYYSFSFDISYSGNILSYTKYLRTMLQPGDKEMYYIVNINNPSPSNYSDAMLTLGVDLGNGWYRFTQMMEVSSTKNDTDCSMLWIMAGITDSATQNDYYKIDNISFKKVGEIVTLTNSYDKLAQSSVAVIENSTFDNITIHSGEGIESLTMDFVSALTGECSLNRTRTNGGAKNADIGLVTTYNGKIYIFFGDTNVSKGSQEVLINNCYAVSTDENYCDGIDISYVLDSSGYAKEITGHKSSVLASDGNYYTEQSRIPNGACQIGNTLYMTFMSVRQFTINNDPDAWTCNFGGLMKSTDGVNWTEVTTFKTSLDSNFMQNYLVYDEQSDYVYIYGLKGGRHDGCRLMRVKSANFETLTDVEYLTGYSFGNPKWGSEDKGFDLISGEVWEISVVYNEYLEKWIFTYTNFNGTNIYTADELWGKFELAAEISKPSTVTYGWYCCYTSTALMKGNGKKMAFLMSFMTSDGVWEVCVYDVTFEKE